MRVAVVATGGTIASRRDDRGDVVPVDGARELFASVPVDPRLDVEYVDLAPVPSFAVGLDEMVAVVLRVRGLLAGGHESVLVTHGTDSLEEMAFLVSMLMPTDAHVVLTGSQRPADDPHSDAAGNLADSLTALQAGLGPCVVMGGYAVAAFEARKVHTSATAAFSGGAAGAIALIDGPDVVPLSRPCRGGNFADVTPPTLPRVDLVKLGAGTDGAHVDASVAAGAAGVVLEAFGRGNAGPGLVDAVERATTAGVRVLVSSRVGHGLVRPVYGQGGGADLARAGADFAGDLTAPRARVALGLALAHPELGPVDKQLEMVWRGQSA
ncbi:asparaginase [Nocardioides anomalus]|uniref:asparaginase n=1 Tax=Nocardioides anomalus TaxID=2712223 RepID=A0A6G6WDE8_9ACTN|nr:asparaginase domain-containing protein [Nocardioides anomalus]QIG43177.1 asparaginase [Nocardioides anomalus]